MSDPSDFLVEYVVKLAKAKTATTDAEQDTEIARARVQKALETLVERAQNILDHPLEDGSYEIAFLDEALRDVNEAERRHEEAHSTKIHAQRMEGLLETLVEQLKATER